MKWLGIILLLGVENFRQSHGLDKTEYLAKDIYPILKKHNAWGLAKFESLITFKN
jgi:hypothetical protein